MRGGVLPLEIDHRLIEVEDDRFDVARRKGHEYRARAVQPDFLRTIVVVLAICIVVFGSSATLLVFAFRAFGTAKRGDVKHIVLLVAAIGLMLVFSVGLLVWSVVLRR